MPGAKRRSIHDQGEHDRSRPHKHGTHRECDNERGETNSLWEWTRSRLRGLVGIDVQAGRP